MDGRYSRTLAIVCAAVMMSTPAFSQARLTGADLEGVVRDESGAVLPAATATVVNTETTVARTIETDADGRFRALALPPGRYRITIDRSGFAAVTGDAIVLRLGDSI